MIELTNTPSDKDLHSYFGQLQEMGLIYHLDDHPSDVVFSVSVSQEDFIVIVKNAEKIHTCSVERYDEIWDIFAEYI